LLLTSYVELSILEVLTEKLKILDNRLIKRSRVKLRKEMFRFSKGLSKS
jgi:hypothetical protein